LYSGTQIWVKMNIAQDFATPSSMPRAGKNITGFKSCYIDLETGARTGTGSERRNMPFLDDKERFQASRNWLVANMPEATQKFSRPLEKIHNFRLFLVSLGGQDRGTKRS